MSDNENTKVSAEAQGDDKKKLRKTTKVDSYSTYIYKVLKQVHPKRGISKKGMAVMNSFVSDIFERIVTEAGHLARVNHKSTGHARDSDRCSSDSPWRAGKACDFGGNKGSDEVPWGVCVMYFSCIL